MKSKNYKRFSLKKKFESPLRFDESSPNSSPRTPTPSTTPRSFHESITHSNNDNISTKSLSDKRAEKRTKFQWLANFLMGKRPSKKELEDKGILLSEPPPVCNKYFSVNISEIYKDKSRLVEGIPQPVYHTVEALGNWLSIEGIFRVSGIFSEMNRLKQTYESGQTPDLSKVDSQHSIAGLLELWLRELPEPITTCALYNEFMSCVGNNKSENESLELLKECCAKMPEENRTVLAFFLRFMNRVASKEEENKMSAKNLGVVFGSILLSSGSFVFSLDMKQVLENQNTIVQYLISNVDYIFPEF